MKPIPESLMHGPFTRQHAIAAGITGRMLRGARFRRLYREIYVVASRELTYADRVAAARLVLPGDAHLTHISRVRELGLDWQGDQTLHFVIARDHHVVPDGIMLHRTEVLPPTDDIGVSPAAAFIAMCATERLIDLVAVGDWMLHRGHMTVAGLVELADAQNWRAGASQALHVARHLRARAASIAESRMRVMFTFAGLPEPELNVPLFDDPNSPIVDMLFRLCLVIVEYEGRHHFRDPQQIKRDVWRYSEIRRVGAEYVQVYDDMMTHPKAVILRVHALLEARGYAGPEPDFGRTWRSLFEPVRCPRRVAPTSAVS